MTEELLLNAVYDQAPVGEVEPLLKLCSSDVLWTRGINGLDILKHAILAGRIDLVSLLLREKALQPAHSHNTLPPNNGASLPPNSGATLPPNNNNTSQSSIGAILPPNAHNAFPPNNTTLPPPHNRDTSPPSNDANPTKQTPNLSPLHLACLLGDKSIVEELIRSSPYNADSRCPGAAWPSADIIRRYKARGNKTQSARVEWSEINDVVLHDLIRRTDEETSALDVAAMTRHIECVHALLDSSGEASRKTSPLERSMELNSIYAFRLLLAESPPSDASVVEAAFKRALSYKRVTYLKALFEHGVDVDHALDGLNPYHVVYLYSSGMRQLTLVRSASSSDMVLRHNRGLDEVTALLLEKRFDVNAPVPLGSYPVYSLITALVHEKDNSPAHVPSYHINSLDLLLKSGVDLNFDEVRHSTASDSASALATAASSRAIGRDLYTSALDAYFCCLQSCDTWRPHIMEHLDRICLSLLEAGANPNYLDARGETPLHALMRTMATQHSMGHMHADLSCMCRMLLYFGADPNVRTTEGGVHPVQLYFTTLLKIMGGVFAFRRWKSSNNATQVLQLFYFMDGDDAIEACRNITAELNAAREDGMPQEVIDYACSMMAEYMNTVKSLQEMSRLALWKAVSRRIVSLKKLHMPRAFIAAIKELFMLDI